MKASPIPRWQRARRPRSGREGRALGPRGEASPLDARRRAWRPSSSGVAVSGTGRRPRVTRTSGRRPTSSRSPTVATPKPLDLDLCRPTRGVQARERPEASGPRGGQDGKGGRNRPRHDELGGRGNDGGWTGRGDPELRGRAHDAARWSPSPMTASGWSARSPNARRSSTPKRRSTRRSGSSAAVGTKCETRSQIVPYKVVRPGRRGPLRGARERARARGDLGRDPPQAGGRRGEIPRRQSHQGRDHRPGLLQRRPAPGDQGRRQDRRPRGAAHHQRADRRGAGLRPRQEEEREDRSSSTSAAAPSTSRCSKSATACSRSSSTNGDTHLGGDDFDKRIID